jgi:hypothetical protein
MVRFLASLFLGTLLTTVGCAASDADETTTEQTGELSASSAPRRGVTVCFAGAYRGPDPLATTGNPELAAMCEQMPGLIRAEHYPFFTFTQRPEGTVLSAVLRALDTNHDGRLNDADEQVELNVVGYSWGGFNAYSFIKAWNESPRVPANRKAVARYFAIDAFRPDALMVDTVRLHVPANVQSFWSFRHSVAPATDCSVGSAMGPYTGRTPLCQRSTVCTDYDYSLAPETTGLGHCDIPAAADEAILALTYGTELPAMPPTRPVALDRP